MTGIEYILLGIAAAATAAVLVLLFKRRYVIPDSGGYSEESPSVESSLTGIREGMGDLGRSLEGMDKTMDEASKAMKRFAYGRKRGHSG